MNLESAKILAQALVELMRPYCDRIEVAGSIRRESEEVKDIEIVAVPRWEDRTLEGVLFDVPNKVNLLHEAMLNPDPSKIKVEWIKPGTSVIEPWPIKADGKYWRGLLAGADGRGPLQTIKLDLFLARPENWGVIYTIRTGSADFSRALVTYARDKTPYRVAEGNLVWNTIGSGPSGELVNCREEEHLFACLDLEWVEPRLRRNERDLQPKN